MEKKAIANSTSAENMSIQDKIDEIIRKRDPHCKTAEERKDFWDELLVQTMDLEKALNVARQSNPGKINNVENTIEKAKKIIEEQQGDFQKLKERFERKYVCIGVGGATGAGKSTFLQSITGLGNDEIPTGSNYSTTAVRSVIVNSEKNIVIADMHSSASFINEVIKPLCERVKINNLPNDVADFRKMRIPDATTETQEFKDTLNRLKDTQEALNEIKPELTGEEKREIKLSDLKQYVAYPDGGKKGGKFQAIRNITIYKKFSSTDVEKIQVIDLPGVGEAGRDLAEEHTSGMKDVCDITLCMKRFKDKVEWLSDDTIALDAMKKANPLLNDQTKFTMILVNNGGIPEQQAKLCLEDVNKKVNSSSRKFGILECDAADKDKVKKETMPKILEFLTINLSDIDGAMLSNAKEKDDKAKNSLLEILKELQPDLDELTKFAEANNNEDMFGRKLYNAIPKALKDYLELLKNNLGEDTAWTEKVKNQKENVDKWIKDGCGYSLEEFDDKLKNEISHYVDGSMPNEVITQIGISFREQWETDIDKHLENRTYEALKGFIQVIKEHTNKLISEPAGNLKTLRKQLLDFVEKVEKTPNQKPGDDKLLTNFLKPLRRLAEFDLKFRFHQESSLMEATNSALNPNSFNKIEWRETNNLRQEIIEHLLEANEKYANEMYSAEENDKFGPYSEELKNQLGQEKFDEMSSALNKLVGSQPMFCPNRIIHAVIERAVADFCGFEDSYRAYIVFARGYLDKLRQDLTEGVRDALSAKEKLINTINVLNEN